MSENKNDGGIVIMTNDAPTPLISAEDRAAQFRKELEALSNAQQEQQEVKNDEQNGSDSLNDSSNDDGSDILDSSKHSDEDTGNKLEEESETESINQSHSIPKKRFNQELQRRKEIEAELQREREARIRMETELNLFNEAAKKLQTKKEEALEINPLDEEAHSYYVNQINALKQEFEAKLQQMEKTQTQTRFETTVNNQAESFKKKHDDFDEAYKFVIDTEIKNAKLIGLDENEAYDFALQKLQPIAWSIYNKGGNVAESVYNMAKNYGYNGKGAKKGSNVNVDNINKNSKKSASIIDDVPAAVTSMANSSDALLKLDNFKALDRKDGRGVDPQAFKKALEEIQNRR